MCISLPLASQKEKQASSLELSLSSSLPSMYKPTRLVALLVQAHMGRTTKCLCSCLGQLPLSAIQGSWEMRVHAAGAAAHTAMHAAGSSMAGPPAQERGLSATVHGPHARAAYTAARDGTNFLRRCCVGAASADAPLAIWW